MNMVYTRIHVCVCVHTPQNSVYTACAYTSHTHMHVDKYLDLRCVQRFRITKLHSRYMRRNTHTHTCVLIYYNIGGYIYIYTFIIYIYTCDMCVWWFSESYMCMFFSLCVCACVGMDMITSLLETHLARERAFQPVHVLMYVCVCFCVHFAFTCACGSCVNVCLHGLCFSFDFLNLMDALVWSTSSHLGSCFCFTIKST